MDLKYTKPSIKPRKIYETSQEEIMSSGHLACPGCGVAIAARNALKILGRKTILVVPACCYAVIDGPFPYSAAGVPFLHCAFETAAITAAGVRNGLAVQGINDITVVAWAGDGGTFDIGLQAVSACAERNEDILYVCYDNEAYMNTGIQRSSATPACAWTTTTPGAPYKPEPKKDIAAIMIAHRIPYFATASLSFLDDFIHKFQKAKEIKGFRFLHILSPCTAGWKHEEKETINLGYLAVHTKIFPLFEVEDSERYTINVKPRGLPVKEYLTLQGRFSGLTAEQIEQIQKETDRIWESLLKKTNGHISERREVATYIPELQSATHIPSKQEFLQMLQQLAIPFDDEVLQLSYSLFVSELEKPSSRSRDIEDIISEVISRVQMLGAY